MQVKDFSVSNDVGRTSINLFSENENDVFNVTME